MSTPTLSRFSFPTDIRFGAGARNGVAARLREEKCNRPLVVTDRQLAKLPMLAELHDALAADGLHPAAFSEVWGNPVKSQVTAGVAAFRAHGADSIIGLGGGAALDVAKAIALLIHHPGDLFDYEDDLPGARPFDQDIPFWVALPTTAGTGSEVGRSAVISDDQSHLKKIIFSPRLLARTVFADPELTVGMPASITAATGMDAITHCIEAYLARGFHPLCDGIALEGLRLGAAHLERAVTNPGDLEARGGMLMASMMGAIAFQKGLGVVHSCAHALGTVCDMHHGLANGLMIDHALAHNVSVSGDRFTRMAVTVGVRDPSPATFLAWLGSLKKAIGIPANLSAQKIPDDARARLIEIATADSCHGNNPRACTREDFARIFAGAA